MGYMLCLASLEELTRRNLGLTLNIFSRKLQYNGTKAATARVAALKLVYHESERLSLQECLRVGASMGKFHNTAEANFMV